MRPMHARPEAHAGPRYFAWLYAPPPLQALLGALLAIEAEVRASLRPGLEHAVAHVRLGWWREECARLQQGRPLHPQTRALLARSAPAPDLSGLVDNAEWDLAAATFSSRAELGAYCQAWAGALPRVAARGAASPVQAVDAAAHFGQTLGTALREAELLVALRAEAHAGRLRLPLDELERVGVEPHALASSAWPEALRSLLRARLHTLRGELAAAVAALPQAQQTPLRGLLVWAALAHRQLERAEHSLRQASAVRAPAATGPSLGTGWLAWRAARRAQQRRFSLGRH
jgi:15-cis-phytoene synthase